MEILDGTGWCSVKLEVAIISCVISLECFDFHVCDGCFGRVRAEALSRVSCGWWCAGIVAGP